MGALGTIKRDRPQSSVSEELLAAHHPNSRIGSVRRGGPRIFFVLHVLALHHNKPPGTQYGGMPDFSVLDFLMSDRITRARRRQTA